jgi:uncharacterized protein YbjT (DUF2867 family)
MTANGRSVLVAGATGLVGRETVRLLLADPEFTRVVALSRRPLSPEVNAPKLEQRVLDFDDLAQHHALFAVDAIICAMGTTIKQAGSQLRFRVVDYEYPLTIARLGRSQDASTFVLVSTLGADPSSRVFYSRLKGELEDALRGLGYRTLTVVRPSLLLGKRAELRLGEEVAKGASRLLSGVIPAKYRPVEARAVAETLVRAAKDDTPGMRVIESASIGHGG